MKRNLDGYMFRLSKKLLQCTTDRTEIFRIFSLLRSVGFAIGAIFVFFVLDFIHGQWVSITVLSVLFICLLYVVWLVTKGHFDAAKYLFIVLVSTGHFLNSSSQGIGAGNTLLYFPFLCSVFLYFDLKRQIPIFVLASFLSLQMVVLEYSHYHLIDFGTPVSAEYEHLNYYLLLFFSIYLCIRFVKELSVINKLSNNKLQSLNKKLKRKNEGLQKANGELDAFVYKASHDMRSPLRSILGLTHLLGQEKDQTRVPEYLHLLEKSTKKLDAYLVEILEMSRNAKSAAEIQKIDLEPFVWEIYSKLQYMMHDRKVEFDLWCKGEDFYSDASRLRMIISNLLGNSIKYCKQEQGVVCKIQLHIEVTHQAAHFLIEDNGQGIGKDALPKIFNMFYRANVSSDGSGLGLYIVKDTLDKLGGKITVSSQIGIGTKVEFTVPNAKPSIRE